MKKEFFLNLRIKNKLLTKFKDQNNILPLIILNNKPKSL